MRQNTRMKEIESILNEFATSDVLVTHEITLKQTKCGVIFHPDLVDVATVRAVIFSIENLSSESDIDLNAISQSILLEGETEICDDVNECVNRLLSGDVLFCVEEKNGYLVINARAYTTRGITEPPTEMVMRGPREGFIEDLKTNLSLIERRLKTPDLAIKKLKVGRQTQTNVAVCYLANVVEPTLVKKIIERIKGIDIDGIVDSHYLVSFLEEDSSELFSQSGVSEKPDIVVAKMLEGRIAILVDGTPIVITLPYLFVEDFQAGDDYYQRSSFATFIRLLRYLGLALATLLPALYVALQNFHYSLIPVRFMITLMEAINGIPLTPLAETLFVLLLFEIIREASVRMPRAVGMAMSIVGALVLGETAVNAGVISSPSVMVTALSSIALFTVPNMIGSASILRLVYAVTGGLFGLFGLIIAVLISLHRVCGANAYGTPYLAPFAPLVYGDFKDSIDRAELRKFKRRPKSIPNINSKRQA